MIGSNLSNILHNNYVTQTLLVYIQGKLFEIPMIHVIDSRSRSQILLKNADVCFIG